MADGYEAVAPSACTHRRRKTWRAAVTAITLLLAVVACVLVVGGGKQAPDVDVLVEDDHRDGGHSASWGKLGGDRDPSQVAAEIIAGADERRRKIKQLLSGDEGGDAPSSLEADYAKRSEAIVLHGRSILKKLLNPETTTPAPNSAELEGVIPFPGATPKATPIPQPPPSHLSVQPDQGQTALDIINASKQSLADSLANPPDHLVGDSKPAFEMPKWKNAGAVAEGNVFDHGKDYVPLDAPEGMGKDKGASDWKTDLISRDQGTGPMVSTYADNGALSKGEGFTINTQVDDSFHGSDPTWLPISQRGLRNESGETAAYTAYMEEMGKKNEKLEGGGPSVTVDTSSDMNAQGESFSISTVADQFACDEDCMKKRQAKEEARLKAKQEKAAQAAAEKAARAQVKEETAEGIVTTVPGETPPLGTTPPSHPQGNAEGGNPPSASPSPQSTR